MFWVCLYFFLFPDLSGEDKTQSADTEDGQLWPKGAGICRVVVWNIFVFCLWSLIYAAYCWLANVLHHPRWGFCQLPHFCPRLHLLSKICEQISVAILAHCFVFFFRLTVGSLMYLGQCDVEMLTGASAIQRTAERLSTEDAAKKFTTVSFKVTPQGMTVTDNERK